MVNYEQLSIVQLGEILLHDGTNRDAQRELQRKIKAAVAKQPPFDPAKFRGKREKIAPAPIGDIVEDIILDNQVNGDN